MDQPGLLQHFQVFGDAIEREIEQLGHLQNGEAFVCSAPPPVGANTEGAWQAHRTQIGINSLRYRIGTRCNL
jgi:hypothetical protein